MKNFKIYNNYIFFSFFFPFFLSHTFFLIFWIFSGSVASLSQHVTPPLRQNPATGCDIEAAQEKSPCLEHRRAFWSPVPSPWPPTPFPIPFPCSLSHPPLHPFSQPHPTPRPLCPWKEQATQPWLPAGTPLLSSWRDEFTEASAARWWKWWSDGF